MYLLKTLKIFWGISLITENDGKHFLGGLIFFFLDENKIWPKVSSQRKISLYSIVILCICQSQMYNFNFLYYLGIQ